MGKATIVSGGTDGKYMVKMDYGKAVRDDRVTAIDKRVAVLVTEIETARLDLNLEMIIYAGVEEAAESAINDYVLATQAVGPAFAAAKSAAEAYKNKLASATATPEEKTAAKAALTAAEAAYSLAQKSIVEALKEQTGTAVKLVDSKKKIAPYRLKMELLQDEKTQLEKDKAYQVGLVLEETQQVWCADFTEDATGLVEIMEIPGENLSVLIGPQDEGHKLTDVGALVAREVQSPEQVFFNAAILPGWQKFKPMYRRGVITKINDDGTADVDFADDKSSAQNLGINRYPKLEGIPVKYMTCDAGAFEVGDKCVLKFKGQNWSFPVIVGFVDNPKPCGGGLYFSWKSHVGGPPKYDIRRRWPQVAKGEKPKNYTKFQEFDRVVGYYTWSSKNIKLKSVEIQLSWGTANQSRYEIPTGSDLWMDGVPLTLSGGSGGQFILAACIVKKDDGYFIRTCRASGIGSESPTFDVVDYGKASGANFADTVQLKATIEFTEIHRYSMPVMPKGISDIYAMADSAGAMDQWFPVSRPCFNESGNAMTLVIQTLDPGGKYDEYDTKVLGEAIAVVEIPAMQIERRYIGGQSFTSTKSVNNSFIGLLHDEGVHINESESSSGESMTTAIIAVDYLADELVWAYKQVNRISVTSETLGYNGDFSRSTNSFQSITYHVTAGHSKHGDIIDFSFTVAGSAATHISTFTSGTLTRTGGMRYTDIAFMGDLSRDCFIMGWAKNEFTPAPVFTTMTPENKSIYLTAPGVIINQVHMQYVACINGVKLGEVFEGQPIYSGSSNDGRGLPTSSVEQVSEGVWRVKDGVIAASVWAVGSGTRPEGNGSVTYSRTRRVSASDIGQFNWGVQSLGSFSAPDFTANLIRGIGFYDFGKPPGGHNAASQSRKTAFFTELQPPGEDFGVCHVVRSSGEVIKMDFSGEVVEGVGPRYLLTPENPVIFDAAIPLS